jgi:hypothetical protein
MRKFIFSLLPVLASLMFIASPGVVPVMAADKYVETRTSSEPFADVVQAVQNGIINRGYVVDYHGFIGDMLKRTATDVGANKTLYENAEFFTFCSAVLSRKMMEANAGDIAFCPYVIFVYAEADDAGTVTLGYRRLPEGGVRSEVNALLSDIITEAAEGF